MKKAILILCAGFALAGCNRQQGGTSDQYNSERGTGTASSLTNSSSVNSVDTNAIPSSQGAASIGGSTNSGSSLETKTNSSSNP